MGGLDVLVVSTSFPLGPGSANGVFVSRLLEAMPDNVGVTVLTPATTKPGTATDSTSTNIIRFRYAPRRMQTLAQQPGGIPAALKANPLHYILIPIFLLAMSVAVIKRARSVNVIHANWSICGMIAGIVGKIFRRPVVTTLRGADLNRAMHSRVDRAIVRIALYLSQSVVTVSHAFSRVVEDKFASQAHKCVTIPNGVSQDFIDTGARRPPINISNAKTAMPTLRMVTVGSLIPRKGIDVILRAMGQLSIDRAAQLTIIGEGAERAALEVLIDQLGIGDSVNLQGQVAPNELAPMLASHDVFILASHSEGRPNVVLEAKAAGLAVIASDIDGVREIIDHNIDGLLFEDNSHGELAERIESLCNSSETVSRLGNAAHRYVVDNQLTWARSAGQYASIYRRLAAS